MFLQHKPSGALVEILNPNSLFDPCLKIVSGRSHCGEEMQDPEDYTKSEMTFPSGEPLPRCWVDPNYRLKIA
jgi:hypothetical protein